MKKENTAIRLKRIMSDRNLRQVDILNLTEPYCKKYDVKMNKSDISQYCSGKTEPNQDKLFVLGIALNVNEAWLMGYDVPMTRAEQISDDDIGNAFANDNLFEIIDNISALSPQEKKHFTNYLQLLEINRKKADNYVEQLLSIQEMDNALQADAAHTRTDIDIPEGTDTSDNDIMDDDDF